MCARLGVGHSACARVKTPFWVIPDYFEDGELCPFGICGDRGNREYRNALEIKKKMENFSTEFGYYLEKECKNQIDSKTLKELAKDLLDWIEEEAHYIAVKRTRKNESTTKTYLMLDKRNGAIKIGRTSQPTVRFREKTLQSENPDIECLFYLEKDIELELHRKFKGKRIRGEWFRLDPSDIENIVNEYNFKPYRS